MLLLKKTISVAIFLLIATFSLAFSAETASAVNFLAQNKAEKDSLTKKELFYRNCYKAMIEGNNIKMLEIIVKNQKDAFEYIKTLYDENAESCTSPFFAGGFKWQENVYVNGKKIYAISDGADFLYFLSLMADSYKTILKSYENKKLIAINQLLSDINSKFVYCRRVSIDAKFYHLKTALELNPQNITAMVELGKLYFEADSMDKCIQVSQEALKYKIDKDAKFVIYYNIGLAKYNKGNYNDAIKYLKKALFVDPAAAIKDDIKFTIYYYIGLANIMKGNNHDAIEFLNKAILIDSSDPLVFYNLSVAYYYSNMLDLAKKNIDFAKEKGLDVKNKTIMNYLKEIDKIKE